MKVALRKLPEALAPSQVAGLLRWRIVAGIADARVGVPAGLMTDALEAAVACGDLGVEPSPARSPRRRSTWADDAGAGAQLAIETGRAHRRHAIGEFGLADAAQLGRTILAVHRMAVDEHRAHDPMAGPRVGQQIVEEIVVAGALPKMVVRIDDRQVGFEAGSLTWATQAGSGFITFPRLSAG